LQPWAWPAVRGRLGVSALREEYNSRLAVSLNRDVGPTF
jgi:hypothetical protein